MPGTSSISNNTLPYRSFSWAAAFIGFGLSGFFDGILLHQILQWHHLLSAVEGPDYQDIELQILADGLFHAAMYAISAIGLWLLWRTRREYVAADTSRRLISSALIGFGAWHIIDGVLSHWLLGIHRIRMDTQMPLFWDLLWFFVFGIAFVAAGWAMRRRDPGVGTGGNGTAAAWTLAFAVAVAAPVASLPPSDSRSALVLFRSNITPIEVFRAIDAAQARIIWSAPSGNLWALDLSDTPEPALLYRHGAYLVTRSAALFGCLSWSRQR